MSDNTEEQLGPIGSQTQRHPERRDYQVSAADFDGKICTSPSRLVANAALI